MATEYTISELHRNLVERQKSSGIDPRIASRNADDSIRRVEEQKNRDAKNPPPPKRGT